MQPIFEVNGLWYFWDETEAYDYGPYKSKEEAQVAFTLYCKQLLEN